VENALQNIALIYAILMSAVFLKMVIPYSVKTVNDLVFFLLLPVTIVYSISGGKV